MQWCQHLEADYGMDGSLDMAVSRWSILLSQLQTLSIINKAVINKAAMNIVEHVSFLPVGASPGHISLCISIIKLLNHRESLLHLIHCATLASVGNSFPHPSLL